MRVIIAGGSGLIGSALASDLAQDGHEAIILTRDPDRLVGVFSGIRAEQWDASTAEGWYQLVNGADAIVNLAGESIGSGRWTHQRKRALAKSRIAAGRAITQAVEMASRKPRVVIQASAVGYYGSRGDESITEESPKGNGFLADLAANWEASTEDVERFGVRRAIIRTGVVLSKKGGALPKMAAPFRYFAGGKLGNGCQWVPWIHISDEVRAIRFLIQDEKAKGPFNLTSPNLVTNAELSRLIGRQLGRPASLAVPAFALKTIFGEMATIVLEGQKALPERLSQMKFVFRFPDADRALQDLLG